MRRISVSEIEGKPALCFDTALDSRSFAQARFFQYINEPGYIVRPDGSVEAWKAAGVIESGASMLVWGPPFSGTRLDLLVKGSQDAALAAIVFWLRARLALAQESAAISPSAALIADFNEGAIHPEGKVFFAPPALCRRCISAEEESENIERYTHPDLTGAKAAAFCAGAMLYRVLAGSPPYASGDQAAVNEDMREGNFTPLSLAVLGIDEKLASLVQNALLPDQNRTTDIPEKLLEILAPKDRGPESAGAGAKSTASFFRPLSQEESTRIAKEKEKYQKKKNASVKTRRFIMRNKIALLASLAGFVIVLIAVNSIINSRSALPTTKGMDSTTVIKSYYNAFAGLDHFTMDACLARGADKNDFNMVMNLYVMAKVRQAYEFRENLQIIGISNLTIERLSGNENEETIRYRTAYTLRLPEEQEFPPVNRVEELTLTRMRGNWQISKIVKIAD